MNWNKIKYTHMNPPTTRWTYFKVIQLPKLWWWCGYGFYDNVKSYWHLNIMGRDPLWPDADETSCPRMFCRYCGRGGGATFERVIWDTALWVVIVTVPALLIIKFLLS